MAVRRHVTASLAAADQVRHVFCELLGDSFNDIPIESTGDWNFFVTSVWGVDSRKLREGLQQLDATGLQATTEDGSRWYLTLFQSGAEPVSFMHEFHLFMTERDPDETADEPEDDEEIDPRLAFLEPEPQSTTNRPWSQFDYVAEDYAEMGIPVADSFRESVNQLNYGAAVNCFRQYESQRMADALRASGLQFDRPTFLDALLWNSTTDIERDSDLGNLPRVLASLGLGGSIAEYVLECDQSPQTPSDSIDAESPDDAVDEYDDFDDEDFEDDDEEMTAAEMANFELEVQKMIQDQQQSMSPEQRKLEHQAKRSAVQFRKDTSPPCDKSKVIYRGGESVYWAADLASWDKLDAKPLKEFQTAMADLQFQFVGDFVCKKFREYVASFFLGPDRKSYGLIMASSFGYAGYEFVSHFENDAHLTTSTSWMAQSYPEVENYAQNCPDKSPADLYQQHLWGVEQFRTHKQTLPIDLPSTLAGIAEMFDQLLARMKSVESDLFTEEDDDGQGG